jgi:hypothetical protein
MPKRPSLLEPGYVTDLPQKGIHDSELRSYELIIIKVLDQLDGASPSFG